MSMRDRDVDRAFDVLRHRRRRELLVALDARTGPYRPATTLRDLSEAIADDDPDPVRVGLVHCHLPQLADAGVVRWDPDARTVERGPAWDAVEPLLQQVVDRHSEAAREQD